jgi:PPM family protein phosphatase
VTKPARTGDTRFEVDVGRAAGVTDRGQRRERNEDAVYVARSGEATVLVVCDGIATAPQGDAAAQLAVHVAGDALVSAAGATRPTPYLDTRRAIAAAQTAVEGMIPRESDRQGRPACTLVCAVCRPAGVTVGWVGDSRAYLAANDQARLLTVDDSLGRVRGLTHWIGADAPSAPPHIVAVASEAPGRLILCSDGFWRHAPRAGRVARLIQDTMTATNPPLLVARRLVDWAYAEGGEDNITVAVADLDG